MMNIERCRYCGKYPKGIEDKEEGKIYCPCAGMARFSYENQLTNVPFKVVTIHWGPNLPLKSLEDASAVWNNISNYGKVNI